MSDTTEDLHHAPTCTRPGTHTTTGHSVDVTRCDDHHDTKGLTCHAITQSLTLATDDSHTTTHHARTTAG